MTQQLAVADALKFAELQMAAEAFIRIEGDFRNAGDRLEAALERGNLHSSKFTSTQAADFSKHWIAVDQRENSSTGFSGTLFKCIADDPVTGAKAGELVIALRSTEFIDDHVRDNQATNRMEIVEFGFAFGQLSDLEDWYQDLRRDPAKLGNQPLSMVGYSLGGHLATAFNWMHRDSGDRPQQVVTFNGAGIGQVAQGHTLRELLNRFTALKGKTSGADFGLTDPTLVGIFGRAQQAIEAGGNIAAADRTQWRALRGTPDQQGITGGWGLQRWSLSDAQESIGFGFRPRGTHGMEIEGFAMEFGQLRDLHSRPQDLLKLDGRSNAQVVGQSSHHPSAIQSTARKPHSRTVCANDARFSKVKF